VEHEQPAGVLLQPTPYRCGYGGLVTRLVFWKPQRGGQAGVVSAQRPGVLSADPPPQGGGSGLAIGILDGELGLPDTAEAAERLRERGGLSRGQGLVHGGQKLFSACEVGVAMM